MPKPLHVSAFEHFNERIPNQLKAFIAYGLFMEAEGIWADTQHPRPSTNRYRTYHNNHLTNHQTDEYGNGAERVLQIYSDQIVAVEKNEFLESALQAYRNEAAEGHSAFRGYGLLEAILGAAIWTIILIALFLILKYATPDAFEVIRGIAGSR